MTITSLSCIVVLNWNGAEDTLACLESLAGVISPSCKVFVVDNGSTDGSQEKICAAFPDIELLLLPCNIGYSGGNNAGFRRARELHAEFVIFLNNDTIAGHDFCAPLLDTLQSKPSAGIAVPKIFYQNRPDTIWYAGGIVTLSTGLIRHVGLRKKNAPEFDRPGVTGYATGCCFAMRCCDFEAIGGFDETFTMYAEDVDLSLRVRSLGMSIEYVPSSRVWHKVSASLSGAPLRKLVKKSFGALRLFRKYRAWSGMALYLLLLPLRLAASFSGVLREKHSGTEHRRREETMQSRYRTVIDGAYLNDPAHGVRWRKTLEFLKASSLFGASVACGLDLGDRTPFTASLEQHFGCPFENTTVDLDLEPLSGSFGVVTAFEVLEHLYNPLHALLEVKRLLAGEDAHLFVSIPLWKPAFLASPDHFHEMTRSEALSLFTRAGFIVVRSAEFRIRHPLFYLTGVKPLLRAGYEKVQIYELAVR